jgi:beta-carotene 3-hydroxylase
MSATLIAIGAFLIMEPITAATHRFVMHGGGWFLHRSHHQTANRKSASRKSEANDAFPVIFAAIVCGGLWLGFNQPGWSLLVPIGIGVTAYGAAYATVHDVYIHGRLRLFGGHKVKVLDYLADCHRIHHLYNGAPYGMLWPVVPSELRIKAARTTRNPLLRQP